MKVNDWEEAHDLTINQSYLYSNKNQGDKKISYLKCGYIKGRHGTQQSYVMMFSDVTSSLYL